jgi:C1A family cysteine protease
MGMGTRFSEANSFPSSYDLRSSGKVSPVRDQNPYGTCWAFAAYGSLESALLPSESWDFSEDNLVNGSGFDFDPYNGGGNQDMTTAYLTRWSGPVREDQDPYPTPGVLTLPPQKHVQEVLYLPGRSGALDNSTIKSAVMTYGGVYTSIYWSNSYYNSTRRSYFYNGTRAPNHAVVIVGWNDDFPASYFSSRPPGNGAFIVRNSWGSSWGEDGYFYVSYYDSKIGGDLAVFNNAEPVSNYSRIYQYDPLGWTASAGYGQETAWFANAFTASASETLVAVSFYTPSLNSAYQIYTGSSLQSLNLCGSGSLTLPGYHTVTLDSPFPLSAGTKFLVAIKLTTPGYLYPIPLEYPFSNYSSGASASSGQSYMSPEGSSWQDVTSLYAKTNVCLKAFTAPSSGSPLVSITPTQFVFQALEGGGNPPPQTLSIQNTGGGTLRWQVSESASWLSLSPLNGSSTGEVDQVTVSANTSGLGAGTYNATITVKNSDTLQVLETVPVTLQVSPQGGASGLRAIPPASLSVQKGTGAGLLSSLFFDDSSYFQVASAFISPYYYIEWTADFQVPDYGNAKFLGVRFKGFNSRSVSTYLKLYNWSTKRWDSLKSASISTSEKEILGTTLDCGKYISASGQVRVQIYGRTSYSSFTNSADLLEVLAGYSLRTVPPSSLSVQKGTGAGLLSSLFFDDSSYFQVASAFISPYYYIEWTADFQVPDYGNAKFLGVRFKGFNSRSVSTYLKLYNWSTKRWDSLKSASISTSEKEILGTTLDCGKYISASGQVRVQIYGRTSYSSFTNSADLLEVIAGY